MYMFSESEQYDFYVRVKQLSHNKQLPVAALPLTSLHKVQCRQNSPLYVIYSRDPNIGKTLRKVRYFQHSFVLCPPIMPTDIKASIKVNFTLLRVMKSHSGVQV